MNHFLARLCTFSARFCTFAAVFHTRLGMSFAFFSAGVTDFGANPTKLFTVIASKAHHFRSRPANCRTLHIQLDTFFKMAYIFFIQTRDRAMIADDCTGIAGVNAVLKLLM